MTAAPARVAGAGAGQLREAYAQKCRLGTVSCKGLACRFPGGEGLEIWSQWLQRRDAITEIPYTRFDLHDVFDPDMEAWNDWELAAASPCCA